MSSPYRNNIDSNFNSFKHVKIRWEKTLNFLHINHDIKNGLDIGDRTNFTEKLENFYKCSFNNTDIDLDTEKLSGDYDVVTAFEIIEHLFNPLHFLLQIKNILKKDGTLYLSTPKGKPYFLWSKEHFHEMEYSRLFSLINRAGFKVVRKQEIRIQPLYFYFTGFRPILRFFFEKHIILELKVS
tara:strand:- start:12947 stop:13495 length:549 start_codon:yes stop_codon:yes gene_type:complete